MPDAQPLANLTCREAAEEIERLIRATLLDERGHDVGDDIEVCKRRLTDYFLLSSAEKGVYVNH